MRGVEPRRSDSAEVTRKTMTRWAELVVKDKDIPASVKLLRTVWNSLPNYPANQIGIPKGLQKKVYKTANPWKEGVVYSTKHFGWRFREDRKPLLIYVKGVNGKPQTDVICITEEIEKLPNGVIVDWDKMREKLLYNKFTPLLEAIGIGWPAVFDRKMEEFY